MHCDRYKLGCAVISVIFRIDLAELDDLCIGQRRSVFYKLNKLAVSQAERRRCRSPGRIRGANSVHIESEERVE